MHSLSICLQWNELYGANDFVELVERSSLYYLGSISMGHAKVFLWGEKCVIFREVSSLRVSVHCIRVIVPMPRPQTRPLCVSGGSSTGRQMIIATGEHTI